MTSYENHAALSGLTLGKSTDYRDIYDASLLQLLPGSGRLRATKASLVEALSDAEDVLIWSVAVSPAIERLKIWEFDSIRGWRSLPDVPERANEPAARLMRLTSLPAEKAYTHS